MEKSCLVGTTLILSEGINLEQKREGNKSWEWNIPEKNGANKTRNKGRSMREEGRLKNSQERTVKPMRLSLTISYSYTKTQNMRSEQRNLIQTDNMLP